MSVENMQPQTGRFLTEDNEKVNLAQILGSTIRSGSIYGSITVGTTATALRLGATDLEERHTLMTINNGSATIFIGFDNAVTATTGIPLAVGQERVFALDPNDGLTLYAISTAPTTIVLSEVK